MDPIKVLICDDQELLVNGLSEILSRAEGLSVVATAYDGEEALAKLAEVPVDVVLMDIRMSNMNGVVATQHIKTQYPNVKVIILTTFDDREYILDAMNYGASGYLLKDVSAEILVDSIRNAYKGDTILPSRIAVKIAEAAKQVSDDRIVKLRHTFDLSEREAEVALMLYDGFTNRQIATALKLSDGSARNHISNIYKKIGAENRAGALNKLKNIL